MITIDIDYETADKVTFESLKEAYINFKSYLDMIEAGGRPMIFEWEAEADKVEIQKHIDAFDVVLSWYCTPDQLEELLIDVSLEE